MNIHNSLQILKESNLKDIVKEVSDAILQTVFTDNGVLSNLPMVGLAFSAFGTVRGVRDIVYLNNVSRFLKETIETTDNERDLFVKELEEEPEKFERLCTSSVALLANFEDPRKATIFGLVAKHRIKKNINTDDYLRLSHAVSKLFVDDLENLNNFNFSKIPRQNEVNLIFSGLLRDEGIGWDNKKDTSNLRIDHYKLNDYGRKLCDILTIENFQF